MNNHNYNHIIYWEQFFLGLLEGDGSIQVNHWKKRSLQFRILIKLKYTNANYAMCVAIRQKLRIMNLHIRHGCVILVEDHRAKLQEIMNIIDRHGLLLTHRRKQYAFFKYCYANQIRYSEYAHIKTLKDLWFGFQSINDYTCDELLQFGHWNNWLCGFTEAEGCFSIRLNNCHSFSISQNHGSEIIGAIKNFFKAPNKIRTTSHLHLLETYAGPVLQDIVSFYGHPSVIGLQGQKQVQYELFKIACDKKSKKLWKRRSVE